MYTSTRPIDLVPVTRSASNYILEKRGWKEQTPLKGHQRNMLKSWILQQFQQWCLRLFCCIRHIAGAKEFNVKRTPAGDVAG